VYHLFASCIDALMVIMLGPIVIELFEDTEWVIRIPKSKGRYTLAKKTQ
jgi:hypothetical protein